MTYRARVVSGSRQVDLTSHSEKLLGDLLPRIRLVDPKWAAQLVEQHPDLGLTDAAAGAAKVTEYTVVRTSNSSDASVQAAQASLLLGAKVGQVRKIAASDPNQALELAASISDPTFHAQALSAVCAAMDPSDTRCSADLMGGMRDDIGRIKDPVAKLRALAALAQPAAAKHDLKTLRATLGEGFDLGQELFERDSSAHPGELSYQLKGFDELGTLAQAGVRTDADTTLARIATVQNQLLQAYLLIEATEALSERHATTVSRVPAASP